MPVVQRRGTPEHGPVGVDEEPLDGHREVPSIPGWLGEGGGALHERPSRTLRAPLPLGPPPAGEGAGEQLHVQLAQGDGPVVIRLGGAWDLGAEPHVRISPVGQRRGAPEHGPVGVDEEPLDGHREGPSIPGWLGEGGGGLHERPSRTL